MLYLKKSGNQRQTAAEDISGGGHDGHEDKGQGSEDASTIQFIIQYEKAIHFIN